MKTTTKIILCSCLFLFFINSLFSQEALKSAEKKYYNSVVHKKFSNLYSKFGYKIIFIETSMDYLFFYDWGLPKSI